jgi:pilus assembly protein Flp/PilA
MIEYFRAYLRAHTSEEGATAVEYGIMVALIAAVIIVAVGLLGGYVNQAFQFINTELLKTNAIS